MRWWTPRLCFRPNCVYFFRLFLSFFPLFLPFLSFSAFPYPFSALFCLFNSSLPFVILLYPFPPSFILSGFFVLIFCPIPLYIPQSFISFPYLFYLLSLYIFFSYPLHSIYSLPLFLLSLLYLPALQFNKCICMTSVVVIYSSDVSISL